MPCVHHLPTSYPLMFLLSMLAAGPHRLVLLLYPLLRLPKPCWAPLLQKILGDFDSRGRQTLGVLTPFRKMGHRPCGGGAPVQTLGLVPNQVREPLSTRCGRC